MKTDLHQLIQGIEGEGIEEQEERELITIGQEAASCFL